MPFPSRENETTEAIKTLRAGDRFCEMLTFWVYILSVSPIEIVTLEVNGPARIPDEGEICRYSPPSEFDRRFSYGSIPGHWIALVDRDNDIGGWLERKQRQDAIPS